MTCLNEIVSPVFESSAELLKYQNVPSIYYELSDTLIQHENSENLLEKLANQIVNCELISHKMFNTSMKDFIENFEKFKQSRSLLHLFQLRLKWLETQLKETPKMSFSLPPTFIGHPLVNQFLVSDAKEWIYDTFIDTKHANNFIRKHAHDSKCIQMSMIKENKKVKVKFIKIANDFHLKNYQRNKNEYNIIKQKLNLE